MTTLLALLISGICAVFSRRLCLFGLHNSNWLFSSTGTDGTDIGARLGESLHWRVGLEVAHDRAVPVAFAPRPLIDPDDPHVAARTDFHAIEQSQDRIGADRRVQIAGEPGAGFTAQKHTDAGQELVEPLGTTGMRPGETRDPLRKDTVPAVGIDAAELPDPPMHDHLTTIRRQIEQTSDVLTVTTIREMTAKRTYCA